jgi:hypothetical protein
MRVRAFAPLLLCACLLRSAAAETVTLTATANAGISSIRPQTNNGHDMDLSWGSGDTLAVRQNQNWAGFENKTVLLNFDAKAVKGWAIKQAFLHVALAKGDLYGVGLCSVLNDWREPTVDGDVEPGAPSWNFRATPKAGEEPTDANWWAWPDSGLYSAAWLHPALRYSHAGPNQIDRYTDPDGVRWLQIPVDPQLITAMACGVSYGMVLTDDKGQVAEAAMLDKNPKPYTYDPSFEIQLYSRHAKEGRLAPKLEITGAPQTTSGAGSIKDLKVTAVNPTSGGVTLEFTAPGASGDGGAAFAYYAKYFRDGTAQARVPRYALPLPAAAGQHQTMTLLAIPRGSWRMAFQAIDAVGSPNGEITFDVSIPAAPDNSFATLKKYQWRPPDNGPAPTTDSRAMAWTNGDLIRIDPLSNKPSYAAGNGMIVSAARNEVVSFQVIVQRLAGPLLDVRVECGDLIGPDNTRITADHIQLFREYYFKVNDKDGVPHWIPDACVPLTKTAPFSSVFSIPSDNVGAEQMNQAVWIDVHTPKDALRGQYRGRVTVTSASLTAPLELTLLLNLRKFALPDEISFPVELNTYSGIGAFQKLSLDKEPDRFLKAERRYYQLAHQHRLTLNILRYSHSGKISEKAAPPLDGEGAKRRVTNWADWDARFGPLLDGSAFSAAADYSGPGMNTPVAQFYLPVHENWPMDLDAYYADKADFPTRPEYAAWAKKSRRLDETIATPYKEGFAGVIGGLFKHFGEKGWTKTNFQFFLNNKYYFKCNFFVDPLVGGGAKPGGRCYWLLDEPVDFDDFDANRFFLSMARRAVENSGVKNVKAQYRIDISNPHMARGLLDGVCDLWDCSFLNEIASSARVRQNMLPDEKWWNYGGGPNVGQPSALTEANFLTRYSWGCAGYLPYWSNFGEGDAWKTSSGLSIFYSGHHFAGTDKDYDGPIPGLRMKMMRRAQQDIEYLNLLAQSKDWDRERVISALSKYADNPESLSGFTFEKLSNGGMHRLREAIAQTIEAAGK